MMNKEGTTLTNWRCKAGTSPAWLSIDFGYSKEIGGLVIDWRGKEYATAYDVLLSDDGMEWTTVYSVGDGNGGRDYVYLPEQEGRILKIVCKKSESAKGFAVAKLQVEGPEFGASANNFFAAIAGQQRRGLYPRYFLQQQCYWTIVGSNGDTQEALINELGTVEVDQLSFTIEPFLYVNGKLVTWNDVSLTQSLEADYLPIPSVQ